MFRASLLHRSSASSAWFTVCLVLGVVFSAIPASAGSMTLDEGGGVWTPTRCAMPLNPYNTGLRQDSEAPAEDLNARVARHNVYARDMQAYMECVSQEAAADMKISNRVIGGEARRLLTQAEEEVRASAAKAKKR